MAHIDYHLWSADGIHTWMLLHCSWAHRLLLIIVIINIDATLSSPVVVITLGAVIGVMFIMIVFIILLSTTTTTILLKSKQALRVQLNLLQAKMKEPQVIYEEIAQLQDSLKSSSPTIDVGENTAYVSAISMNACVRIST